MTLGLIQYVLGKGYLGTAGLHPAQESEESLARDTWDAVILDPPRQGSTRGVLEQLFVRIAPPRVTYVSCNPAALARELPLIRAAGYAVRDVRAVDMFPHTEHIETAVRFERS